MNRVIFSLTALLGALMPLVFDSAFKGAALLGIAAFCALLLHRASAATRHLVWFVAIVALLVVPVLSVTLPQWRVLPGWAVVRPLTAASGEVRDRVLPAAATRGTGAVTPPSLTGTLPDSPTRSAELPAGPLSPAQSVASDPVRTWHDWLAPVWGVGFMILALRLLGAHLLLRCAMRGCRAVRATPGNAETDVLAAQLDAACVQLGIRQRVILLLDERRTIPVVWGVFRPRLLLPAEALEWSDAQVRSVLLHELAHIQRRDTLVQWLTQIACALHWWNPLVWLAAWRLHAERERACDDLVLASGVRPSAYAEHLLHVATKLSPARWTAACGLAMARNSSLEGRLLAVLSQKLNRRGATRALAATALAIGALIAVPLAMLRAAEEGNPPPAKLAAGPTRGSADRPDAPAPQRKEAGALYENWQRLGRANGDIPGALVGELAAAVRQFIQYNPTWKTVPQLNAILPRLDAARDWKASDAIALLDEIAAVQDSPLDMRLWRVKTIRQGEKLPQKFAGLDWRGPANGPRVAWVLEPASLEHRLGAALKARLLVWNPGPASVAMQVPNFHQGGVTASEGEGVEVQVSGISWTTLGESVAVRLGPGEYVEINTPGVGLGNTAGREPWAGPRVGFHVLAKAGAEITLAHSPVPLDGSGGGIRDGVPPVVGAGWWLAHIRARLSRELPLPSAAVEREHLLQRVVTELFEATPTGEEMAAFTTDQTSGALDALARRLAERKGTVEFAGKLAPAPIRFRVLAADPAAAEVPRVVLGPGEYPIGKGATLRIVGRPDGERYIYDTTILFEASEVTGKLPTEPHKVEIPGDRATWAIVCRPGAGHFYVLHRGTARKIDYTNPPNVTDAPATDLPAGFRDEVKRQLDLHGASAESQAEVFERPAPPAASPTRKEAEVRASGEGKVVRVPDDQYENSGVPVTQVEGVTWNAAQDGLALGYRITGDEWRILGKPVKVELWVRNAGAKAVKFQSIARPDIGLRLKLRNEQGEEKESTIVPNDTPPLGWHRLLPPGHAFKVKEVAILLFRPVNDVSGVKDHFFPIEPGAYEFHCELELPGFSAMGRSGRQLTPSAGEWTGRLTTRGPNIRVVPLEAPAPKVKEAGPRADARTAKARGEIAKLTPDDLLGAWRGTVNQERLMVSFHRPPAEQGMQCDIYFGESTIGALARFAIAEDGGSAEVIRHSAGGGMKFGTLIPIEPGKLKLELYGRQKGQQEVILVRDPERAYPKVGVPIGDVEAHMEWSAVEQDGLCVGMRIAEDAEWYVGAEVKVELWACNSSQNDVRFQYCPRRDIGLRVYMKGPDGKEQVAAMRQYRGMPSFHRVLLPGGHMFKLKEFSVVLLPPGGKHDGAEPHFTLPAGEYQFRCEVDLPGTTGANAQGQRVTPAEGEWKGRLRTSQFGAKVGAAKEAKNQAPSDAKLVPGRDVLVLAPDSPAPKPRVENMDVDITQDGEVSLLGKRMLLAELKDRAARNARNWFSISAGKEVPYARVVEVVDALKAAGVTEISFRDAQMGDGKYRVANRQAVYKFDGNHSFSICRPGDYPQYFTVGWPAEGERPACWLRAYPNVNGQTQGKWAVVWEPGMDVLWWVDDSDVGKMRITDPANVIVNREGRRNNFSADFGLPEGVVTEFRRLGFEIGRDKTPGLEIPIGGNTGGQSVVSAEFGAWIIQGRITDADGRPLRDVPVRVAANQEIKTAKTDAKGGYQVAFSLPLQLLAHWRAVTVEPVLDGFTERDMAKAGEFNVLLRAGELPQHVRLAGDEDFRPGPIPRFADRDLIPSKPGVSPGTPGRADFVMLQAGEITGEIVTADGMPAPPHFIAAATAEQRPGHHAAVHRSDALGRFRLPGIPTNKPVIITVNPDGKPGETSKSSELSLGHSGKARIRVILPGGGSGKGPARVERIVAPGT